MRFPKSPHEEESPNARLCSFHPGKTKQLDTRIKNITIQQTQNLNEMTQRCKIRQILVWKHLGAVSSPRTRHSNSSQLSVRWPLLCRRMLTSFQAALRLQLFPMLTTLGYLVEPLALSSQPGQDRWSLKEGGIT